MTPGVTPSPWRWPDELDAVAAALGFHTVLYADDRVRVLDGGVAPGDIVPCAPTVGSARSAPVVGTAVGAPLTPHTFENVGTEEFRTLTVEMKDMGRLPG